MLDIRGTGRHAGTVTTEPQLRNRIRVARAERRLSQEELARLVNVSRQTISAIETGQWAPSTLLALRLAGVLGVRVDELFWLEAREVK